MSFSHVEIPSLGRTVHRLGLALNYGITPAEIAGALDRGINYVFWGQTQKEMAGPLKSALGRDRERLVIATGPTLGYFGGSVRKGCDEALAALGTDYIDVFQLYWLGKSSAWTEGTIEALTELKAAGKVRALAVSIHDRPRAGQLAADSPLDLLMIRYNAAHPGAEQDIFPHLAGGRQIVAYTATSWRKLLTAPSGWTEPVPTAGDCYRFCLSNPHVAVTLCGPANLAQLDENLAALARGPLSPEEDAWMRRLGQRVRGPAFIENI